MFYYVPILWVGKLRHREVIEAPSPAAWLRHLLTPNALPHMSASPTGCHDRAVLLYEYVGKRMVDLQHTEVPDAYRGRGIAKHLAKVGGACSHPSACWPASAKVQIGPTLLPAHSWELVGGGSRGVAVGLGVWVRRGGRRAVGQQGGVGQGGSCGAVGCGCGTGGAAVGRQGWGGQRVCWPPAPGLGRWSWAQAPGSALLRSRPCPC